MRPIFLLLMALSLAAAPAKKDAKPPEPPRVRDGLVNGSIRFLVPASWEIEGRDDNGKQVRYNAPEAGEGSTVGMVVTPQQQGIPVHDVRVRAQLAKAILAAANEELKTLKVEVLDPPKAEVDDRFMLRMHERYKDGDITYDRVHFYRGIGFNLIDVAVTAVTDDKETAKKLHDAGATMLMSVTTGPADPKIIRPKKE